MGVRWEIQGLLSLFFTRCDDWGLAVPCSAKWLPPPQMSVSKKGQKLGIRYDDSDGMALVIKIINPGVFYATEICLSK